MRCPVCSTPMVAATNPDSFTCDSCLSVQKGKRLGDYECPKCSYYLCAHCLNARGMFPEDEEDEGDSMFPEEFFDEEGEEI